MHRLAHRTVRLAIICGLAGLVALPAWAQSGATPPSPAHTWADLRAIADSLSGRSMPVTAPGFDPIVDAGRGALEAYVRASLAGETARADSVLTDCRLAATAVETLYGSPFLQSCLGVVTRLTPDQARSWLRADSLGTAGYRQARTAPDSARAALAEASALYFSVGDSLFGGRYAGIRRIMDREAEPSEQVAALKRVALDAARRGDLNIEAGAYMSQAWALRTADTPDTIVACHMRAAEIHERTKDAARLLADWNSIGGTYWNRKRYGEARAAYQHSLDLGTGSPRMVAAVLIKLSGCWSSLGHPDSALVSARRSLDISRRENLPPETAWALSNIGDVLSGMGEADSAIAYDRASVAVARGYYHADHRDVAWMLNNLSDVLMDLGDYAAAEPLIRETLAMRKRLFGEAHHDVAVSLGDLGRLLGSRGDHTGAEPLLREALAVEKQVNGERSAFAPAFEDNLVHCLVEQGRYAEAESIAQESLTMRRQALGEQHPDVAEGLERLGQVRRRVGDYAGAEKLQLEAQEIRTEIYGREHPSLLGGLTNLAWFRSEQSDEAGAALLLREVVAMRKKLLGDDHPSIVPDLWKLAVILDRQGDHLGAETALTEAARIYDAARLRAGTGLERSTFQDSPSLALAAVSLELGKMENAWPAAERTLSRSLADLLFVAGGRHLDAGETAREDSLKRAIGELEGKLGAFVEAARTDSLPAASSRVAEARNELLAAQARWSSFQRDIAEKHPVTEGQAYTLERVQSALGDRTAIVGWLDWKEFYGGDVSWGYVIRNRGPVAWSRLDSTAGSAKPKDLLPDTRSFRDALTDAAAPPVVATREARALWRKRIQPLAAALAEAKDLVVVSSGEMAGIPVEALMDSSGAWLGDAYTISYTPSATIFAWLQERATSREGELASRALLVGDPPFNVAQRDSMAKEGADDDLLAVAAVRSDTTLLRSALSGNTEALSGLPRLPGTRAEVRAVGELAPGADLLLGPAATEQELVRLADSGELRSFGTIHLATHALIDQENPERCALVLSQVDLPDPLTAALAGERIYDGLVTTKEILQEWKLDADLVTLSACETALGKQIWGEGTVGFAHAFLQAGARSLVESLWKVDDRATSLLMRRFYENRWGRYSDERNGRTGEPMTKAEALREAKRWLRGYTEAGGRKPYAHPYFWSGFILLGER